MKRQNRIQLSLPFVTLLAGWVLLIPGIADSAPATAPAAPKAPVQFAPLSSTPASKSQAKPAVPSLPVAAPASKAVVQPATVPAPAPSAPLVFYYDPKGKADPFKPFVEEDAQKKKQLEQQKAAQLKAQQKTRPLSPLQRLSLENFKLVGIAGNERIRKAIVQDGSGKFYPIVLGTLIGLNSAKVVAIRENSILLEEPSEGRSAKSKKKQIEMKLRKEGDEGIP